jgi:hypothetical protein
MKQPRSEISQSYITQLHKRIDWAIAQMEAEPGHGTVTAIIRFGGAGVQPGVIQSATVEFALHDKPEHARGG